MSCDFTKEGNLTVSNTAYTDEVAESFAKEAGVNPRPNERKFELDETGAFIRQTNTFIEPFGSEPGNHKAEANRFAIYWAKGCHWSNRPVITRDILGLTDLIKDQLVTQTGETNVYGHGFGDQEGFKDPITGVHFLSEFYKNANPNYTGRATTPTLVDIKDLKAVNNDYHRLTNYLEVQFRPFQPKDAPDLYPVAYRKEIDEFNDWLFPTVNNGHYRMSFCSSLSAYEEAFADFYAALDKLEVRLSNNRFIFGDFITDADIRVFPTLVRWDIWYYRNVGPIHKRIRDYPNLWAYTCELYNIPAFHKNTYVRDIALRRIREGGTDFASRIAGQIDYEKFFATDGSRKALSKHPDQLYLKHPEGETVEDYIKPISKTHWNDKDIKVRNPNNRTISVDPSINPLKGIIDK